MGQIAAVFRLERPANPGSAGKATASPKPTHRYIELAMGQDGNGVQ
jgi:hypothetical protein